MHGNNSTQLKLGFILLLKTINTMIRLHHIVHETCGIYNVINVKNTKYICGEERIKEPVR